MSKAITKVFFDKRPLPRDSFLETFKYKQFARNYALTNNVQKAYELTFGDDAEMRKMFRSASAILALPEVQMELEKLYPSDHDIFDALKEGLNAPTPPLATWSEKHKFMETAMKLKGYLKPEGAGGGTQVNIGMVIEEVVHEPAPVGTTSERAQYEAD